MISLPIFTENMNVHTELTACRHQCGRDNKLDVLRGICLSSLMDANAKGLPNLSWPSSMTLIAIPCDSFFFWLMLLICIPFNSIKTRCTDQLLSSFNVSLWPDYFFFFCDQTIFFFVCDQTNWAPAISCYFIAPEKICFAPFCSLLLCRRSILSNALIVANLWYLQIPPH